MPFPIVSLTPPPNSEGKQNPFPRVSEGTEKGKGHTRGQNVSRTNKPFFIVKISLTACSIFR